MSYHPYANPYVTQYQSSYSTPSAGPSASAPAYNTDLAYPVQDDTQRLAFDASLAEQSSIYTPEAAKKNVHTAPGGKAKGRTTVLRKGGGEVWEDQTLMEWDPG